MVDVLLNQIYLILGTTHSVVADVLHCDIVDRQVQIPIVLLHSLLD